MKNFIQSFILPLAILVPVATTNAQQIHIKARFIEVPNNSVTDLEANIFPADLTNGFDILTATKANQLLNRLSVLGATGDYPSWYHLPDKNAIEVLAEPEVVTVSGRQIQMRSTQIINVVTNFAFREIGTNRSIAPQMGTVETGPVFDAIPTILSDGYTIDLRNTALLTEFLGYEKTTNTTTAFNTAGDEVDLPKILPGLRVRKENAHVKLYDGQTLALSKFKTESTGPENFPKHDDKELLVLVTVTLVDPAGNRIHTDDELPFTKDAVPIQDTH